MVVVVVVVGWEERIEAMRNRVYLKAAADYKASLSFGRTSAGIVL